MLARVWPQKLKKMACRLYFLRRRGKRIRQSFIGCGAYDDLRAMLVNLLDNAIKYGHANTPIQMDWALADDKIEMSVINQGDGIDPIHIPRLTERFFRVDRTVRARLVAQVWG